MSSLRNAIPRRAHKERAQPESRKKYGFLEKKKDYALRAKAFHKKEQTLRNLKLKAEFRNPDEFNFKMINSKLRDGVHQSNNQVDKYTQDELMLMKTQDASYILLNIQSEKKKIEKLTATLHSLDYSASTTNRHVYYADDREEVKEIKRTAPKAEELDAPNSIPLLIKKETESSYKELEIRKSRAWGLEKIYNEMCMQKELQKKGRKRKLRDDEIVSPTSGPVYKWRAERKR